MKKSNKTKKKNVAICFSGQVKHLELCYPYLKKNLLDGLGSYDLFCYAEDDKDLNKIELLNPTKAKKIKSSYVDQLLAHKLKTLKKKNYKNYILSESFRFNFRNMYQQLFKIKGACVLLEEYMEEENTTYNYFIRIRFDFLPIDKIKLNNFKIKKNEVITPEIKGLKIKNQINDMFCITKDLETFKSYCYLYDNLIKTVESTPFYPTLGQKLYFIFEKKYNNFFIYLSKQLSKNNGKFSRTFLGIMLAFTKIFYKEFKEKNRCATEKAFFYHLKSENKNILDKPINFVIVQNPMEGLLILG